MTCSRCGKKMDRVVNETMGQTYECTCGHSLDIQFFNNSQLLGEEKSG